MSNARTSSFALVLTAVLAVSASAFGQLREGTPTYRAEARQVLVTVAASDDQRRFVPDLTEKDFQLFQDGKEQSIKFVRLETLSRGIPDNVTGGTWWFFPSIRGTWGVLAPKIERSRKRIDGEYLWSMWRGYYLLGYVPPPSAEGSCHSIRVSARREVAALGWGPRKFCNVNNNQRSDLLWGTSLGKKLEKAAAGKLERRLDLSAQVPYFYAGTSTVRVHVAAEFPHASLKVPRYGPRLATFGILGIVRTKGGTVAARFSDSYQVDRFDPITHPSRFETEIVVPPGEYDFALALTIDGEVFGDMHGTLNTGERDSKHVALSGIALCKQFRSAAAASADIEAILTDYYRTPLISEGILFSPAGNTRFKKSDPAMVYFEIYEPPTSESSKSTVQFRLKITDVKSGESKLDTEPMSAAPWMKAGERMIPVAVKVGIDKLPKGSYELGVQALDSNGGSTVWRTTAFSVE